MSSRFNSPDRYEIFTSKKRVNKLENCTLRTSKIVVHCFP